MGREAQAASSARARSRVTVSAGARERARASTVYPPPPPLLPPQHGGDDIVKLSTGQTLVASCLLILTAIAFSPTNRRHLAALRLQPPRSRPLRLRKLRLLPRGHSVLVA